MKIRSALLGAAIAASCVVLPAVAFAGSCQAYSGTWLTRMYCGNTARGYAEGYLDAGEKALRAMKTSSSVKTVGVRGIDSSGRAIDYCSAIDSTNNGVPARVIGGGCESGVRFGIQINF